MIRFSVAIQRGCFGGCTFCSITEHEGRIIQSRSEDSVIREIETIRDHGARIHRRRSRISAARPPTCTACTARARAIESRLPPSLVRLSRACART